MFSFLGKITSLDTSLLRASMKPGWEDLVRRCIQRFHLQNDGEMSFAKKHQQDGSEVTSHMKSALSIVRCQECVSRVHVCVSPVLRNGHALSPLYRFSLSDGTIVSAHTKSKLVRSPTTSEPQLYLSLHILQRYQTLTHLSLKLEDEVKKISIAYYSPSDQLLRFKFLLSFNTHTSGALVK